MNIKIIVAVIIILVVITIVVVTVSKKQPTSAQSNKKIQIIDKKPEQTIPQQAIPPAQAIADSVVQQATIQNPSIEFEQQIQQVPVENTTNQDIQKPTEQLDLLKQDGVYKISSKLTPEKSIDVWQMSRQPEAHVKNVTYIGGDNQKFQVDLVSRDTIKLIAMHSGMYLNGGEGKNTSWIAQSNGDKNSVFKLEPVGDGYYLLNLIGTDLYLDITNYVYQGANVIYLTKLTKKESQQWLFTLL